MQSVQRSDKQIYDCDSEACDPIYKQIVDRLEKTKCHTYLSRYFIKQITYSKLDRGSEALQNFAMASDAGLAPRVQKVLWQASKKRIVILCEKCRPAAVDDSPQLCEFFEKMGGMGILRVGVEPADLVTPGSSNSVLCCSWPSPLTAGLAKTLSGDVDPARITFLNMVSAASGVKINVETLARYVPVGQKRKSETFSSLLVHTPSFTLPKTRRVGQALKYVSPPK
jgi:hypothetical protein